MLRRHYQNFEIELSDITSADNSNHSKYYFSNKETEQPSSKLAVKIFRDGNEIAGALIAASGGGTCVHETSSLTDENQLIICCGDTVFCLTLPDLVLRWKTRADQATCFQVFKLGEDYIVHGELQITRLDRDGKIKWQFSGSDIFVSSQGEKEFSLENDHIALESFDKIIYRLDFDGNLL